MAPAVAPEVDVEIDTDGPDGFDGEKFRAAGSQLPPKPGPGVWRASETRRGYRFRFLPRIET